MLDFSEIKLGKVVSYQDQPCVITNCAFLRMQQAKPVKKCTLKNLITGRTLDYSFKSGEKVEEADLVKRKASFLYKSGDRLSFMLETDFETIELPESILGDKVDYLKEGLEVTISYFNDEPIGVDLPIKVSYTVINADPGVKGNSASNVMKDATIETGRQIKVPLFIEPKEQIVVNTVEDEYVGRDNS